jgi:phosphate starvation-inducible PhoH-like protein
LALKTPTYQFTPQPVQSTWLANLCGVLDGHIHQIAHAFDIAIRRRGDHFNLHGDTDACRMAIDVLTQLYAQSRQPLADDAVQLAIFAMQHRANTQIATSNPVANSIDGLATHQSLIPPPKAFPQPHASAVVLGTATVVTPKNAPVSAPTVTPTIALKNRRGDVKARTPSQQAYVAAITANALVFGLGPAGTGKTYLAVACAVDALEREQVERIILTRPAVEAGEKLGFLPGDLSQKIDPYVRPLYDALFDLLGAEKTQRYLDKHIIEVAPLAFMRGRTLNNAFVILDEAQNTTPEQLKMFLTRLGFGSQMVVTGDLTQIDLPKHITSGLRDIQLILESVKGVAFHHFDRHDVVRHPLVGRIVSAYESHSQ